MIKKLFILFAYIFVLGCQTSTEVTGDLTLATYLLSTKAQITDKISDSSNGVTIDIFLKKNEVIRLEISALLGFQVGSLLMTRSTLQYAVHPQKYFIQGPLVGRTLRPLFKQDIDPQILWSLIHNESLKQRGFQCQKLDHGAELCKNQQATVEIEQRGEIGANGISVDGQKKVTLENAKMKMIWIFKSIEVVSRNSQNETFVLVKPKEYKLITIK